MKPFEIKIAERLLPFSSAAGIKCLIPGSLCEAKIFPTALRLNEKEFLWDLTGPIKQFLAQIDLEKGLVKVSGISKEGFFRYLIFSEKDGIYLYLEKGELPLPLKKKKKVLTLDSIQELTSFERLSLGNHKKQEWEQVYRRGDLSELFPLWLRVANLTPCKDVKLVKGKGNFYLLQACNDLIEKKDKLCLAQAFENLFFASFSGVFVPQVNDPNFLGLSKLCDSKASPYPLLKSGASLIRSLFFKEERDKWHLLPLLPPAFHSGRFLSILTQNGDLIDMEWTKKLLRRVVITPSKERTVRLSLQKSIKRFRVRTSQKDRGTSWKATESLLLKPSKALFLDRFDK